MQYEEDKSHYLCVFCITKCMIIIETKYPQSNKKEKETKDGKQKKRSND